MINELLTWINGILGNAAHNILSALLVLVVVHARPRPADFQPGALLVDKVRLSLISCRVQEAE